METIGSMVQSLLDAGLLVLCLERMFQEEKKPAVPGRYLLYPVLVILCMGIRISYVAGGTAPARLALEGYEIAPADNIYALFVFMLMIAFISCLYYGGIASDKIFLCGSIGVFSVYLSARLISVFLFMLCGAAGNVLWFGSRILSLLLAGIFLYSPVFAWCRQVVRGGGFAVKLVFTNIAAVLSILLCFFSFDIGKMEAHLWGILLLLLFLFLLDGGLLVYDGQRIQERKRIRMIEQYVPVVEELISQVRSRQHEFDNRILAIEAALLSAGSLEEAREAVAPLTEGVSLEAGDRELLSCDSKIIAGLLYQKRRQASLLHMDISVELQGEFRRTSLPETEWVEIIGILLDNAMEASESGDKIYVLSHRAGDSMEFTVSNPYPPMSNTEFIRLFGKGVTTKSRESGFHGYGLYNVRSIMERCHGKVITRNEMRSDRDGNDRNYVVFGVRVVNGRHGGRNERGF